MSQPEVLSQAFELGFTYTRSTGPVVGRFLTEQYKGGRLYRGSAEWQEYAAAQCDPPEERQE